MKTILKKYKKEKKIKFNKTNINNIIKNTNNKKKQNINKKKMFRYSLPSMEALLEHLKKRKVITKDSVYNAMRQVDRADFTNSSPYADNPQYIDCNATISAPHMHAYALEYLSNYLTPSCHVLDVGSGSGYL